MKSSSLTRRDWHNVPAHGDAHRVTHKSLRRQIPKTIGLLAIAVPFAIASENAYGFSLAEISVESALGQPLRAIVPIVGRAEAEMADCLGVAPPRTDRADEIPEISRAQVELRRGAISDYLVVTTSRSMHEPAVRLTIQAGCSAVFSREYVVLLDPPIESATPIQAAPTIEDVARSAESDGGSDTAFEASHDAPSVTLGKSAAGSPSGVRTKPATSAARPPVNSRSSAVAKQARKSAAAPSKLVISRSAPVAAGAKNAVAPKLSEQEMLNAIDEDTEALRRRVAELKETIERMNAQLLVEEARGRSAELASMASVVTPAKVERDWRDDWMAATAVAVALVVGATAGAVWASRRSRIKRYLRHVTPMVDSGSNWHRATHYGATRNAAASPDDPPICSNIELDSTFDDDVTGPQAIPKHHSRG